MEAFEKKLYDAIFEYLSETMTDESADEQARNLVGQIIELNTTITYMVEANETDTGLLSKKYHTLKNLLLYGDFYYESDLCQDIEEKLRETKNTSSILEMHSELQSSLLM